MSYNIDFTSLGLELKDDKLCVLNTATMLMANKKSSKQGNYWLNLEDIVFVRASLRAGSIFWKFFNENYSCLTAIFTVRTR